MKIGNDDDRACFKLWTFLFFLQIFLERKQAGKKEGRNGVIPLHIDLIELGLN